MGNLASLFSGAKSLLTILECNAIIRFLNQIQIQ